VDFEGVRSGSGKSLGWPRVETIVKTGMCTRLGYATGF
jgi:hypothetical protein